jgi:hypothetical protein
LPAQTEFAAVVQSAAAAAGDERALDKLLAAMRAATAARSFRARIEAEVDGEKSDFALDFAAPNHYRMSGAGFEFVIIGKEGFVKLGEQWQRAPKDEADDSNAFNVGNTPVFWDETTAARLKPLMTVKTVTDAALAGQAMKLYEYELKDAFGHKGGNTARTWISAADGLPRKTEVAGDYDGVKSKAVMTWLEYNADLKIEPPTLPQ